MSRRRIIMIGTAAVLLICLVVAASLYYLQSNVRTNLRETRPFVMITSPLENEIIPSGTPAFFHAVARETEGLASIELWVDGEFVAQEIAVEDTAPTMLVIHEEQSGLTAGPHEIIVRATSAWGSSGSTSRSFQIEASATGGLAAASEAASSDTDADRGEPSLPAGSAPPRSPDSPDDPAAAPGSMPHLGEWLPIPATFRNLQRVSEPLFLQVEIAALRTDRDFGGLHCYLGAGDTPPRWFPDEDFDQSTDESFVSLGDGFWDVSEASSDQAPYFLWHTGEAIPLDLACVAHNRGGTDAFILGEIVEQIDPEAWDGTYRRYDAAGPDGSFSLELGLFPVDEAPDWQLLDLDPDMTWPTNLRMGFYTLHWDYNPEPDEAPIDYFRIKLDGETIWTEPRDARQTYLPYEWLSPPCGESYEFTVDAFRGEDWSYPSNPVTVTGGAEGSDACDRTLILRFNELETFDMPSDEEYDGLVAPLSGSFYAGEEEIRFDSSCSRGGYCDHYGIGSDEVVNVSRLTSHWGPGPAQMTLNIPPGEDLIVGFQISDHDGSRSSVLCEDWAFIEARLLDRAIDSSMGDHLVGCRVTYTLYPALGSVVGAGEDEYPLPQLGVTDLTMNDATGQLRVHVRNYGRATWPGHDLQIQLIRRDGSYYGTFEFEGPVIRPGQTKALTSPALVVYDEPLTSMCVELDPGNLIPEEEDRDENWSRQPYCRPLPDLIITGVGIDLENRRLEITVRNIGSGSINHRSVTAGMRSGPGVHYSSQLIPSTFSLDPWESTVLVWDELEDRHMESLRSGVDLQIDPSNNIAEVDDTNNVYRIPGAETVHISWSSISVPYYLFDSWLGRHINEDHFYAVVRVVSNDSTRELIGWRAPRREDEVCRVQYSVETEEVQCATGVAWIDVELFGDESIELEVRGHLHVGPIENGRWWCIWDCNHFLGRGVRLVPPEEWSEVAECAPVGRTPFRMQMYPTEVRGGSWGSIFRICR